MCGKQAQHPHHIIRAQVIRREQPGLFELIRWDIRNQLRLCWDCHEQHHAPKGKKIPRSVVMRHAPRLSDFAQEYDLERALEKELEAHYG
jgi:hypothetical protein